MRAAGLQRWAWGIGLGAGLAAGRGGWAQPEGVFRAWLLGAVADHVGVTAALALLLLQPLGLMAVAWRSWGGAVLGKPTRISL